MRDHVNLSLVLVPPLPPLAISLALMTVQTRACCFCARANMGYCAGKRIADTGNATDSIVLSF